MIFALATPLVIKDFGVTLPEYRSGLQIALLVGILGMYVWPWLADRYGRRTLLAINIALFSLLMPVAALTTTFAAFVAVRARSHFALNGEWSLGSMLVAETWPAHMRGRVIGINRGTWCFGAALAGVIASRRRAGVGARAAGARGRRFARGLCAGDLSQKSPATGSRTQDRGTRRIDDTLAAGGAPSAEDRTWYTKADKIGIRQVFMPDVLPATLVATFIACCSCCIYGTVGAWLPLYLSTEKHWSTAE